jgi:RNA polymerase sigma factor (sigma-70 family)
VDSRRGQVEEVYRRRLAEFRRVAAAVSGDRDSAADVVQEAFVRAVRQLGTFRGDGPLEAWLWRIVLNTARNHRRDVQPVGELPVIAASERNGGASSEVDRVAAAVAALPERQRLVLFLHYYADLDYQAIAATLDIRLGTVGATLTAARSTVQRALSKAEAAT